jgi:hypothetical protein
VYANPGLSLADGTYVDASGKAWTGKAIFELRMEYWYNELGQPIEGAYTWTVKDQEGHTKNLSGTFRACLLRIESIP